MFHEGADPAAARAFREIARLTGGAYLPFDARAAGELRALLAAVGAYAAGGRPALEAAGPARRGGCSPTCAHEAAVSPPLWAALIVARAGRGLVVARILARLPPRQALAVVVLAAAAGLAVMRLFPLALPLAAVGVGLWRSGGGHPDPGRGQSEVESPGLRMTLDHDSGRMDGEVTGGAIPRGASLGPVGRGPRPADGRSSRPRATTDSVALLLSWLERHGPRRRESATATPGAAHMSEAEAYRVLGLAPGASLEEVRTAYSRLIRRVHPDLGGSDALAALLNAAKEVLDPG